MVFWESRRLTEFCEAGVSINSPVNQCQAISREDIIRKFQGCPEEIIAFLGKQLYPARFAKRNGSELLFFHPLVETKEPHVNINYESLKVYDFSAKSAFSGSFIDFCAMTMGMDMDKSNFNNVVRAIMGETPVEVIRQRRPIQIVRTPEEEDKERIKAAPAEPYPPGLVVPRQNNETGRWYYRNSDSLMIMSVIRSEPPDKKRKVFTPWKCVEGKLYPAGQPKPRTIYNLDKLIQRPTAPVLIVEGEKAADAAQSALPDWVVTTWQHGAKNVEENDWSPLNGRNCTIWPDADVAGIEAGKWLQATVPGSILLEVTGRPDGWDAADAVAQGENISDIINLGIVPFGTVGKLYYWMMNNTYRKHPAFAAEAAFQIVSSVTNGWFQLGNTLPMIYSILVGDASCGKNAYHELVVHAINQLDASRLLEAPGSHQGFTRQMIDCSTRAFAKDEILAWMKRNFSSNSPNSGLLDALCTIWGRTNKLPGVALKKKEDSQEAIINPVLSLFGTGTQSQLRELIEMPGLNQSGFLSRCLFITSDAKMKGNRNEDSKKVDLPPEVTDWYREEIVSRRKLGNYVDLSISREASAWMRDREEEADDEWDNTPSDERSRPNWPGAVRQRDLDRTRRYAMLLALGDFRDEVSLYDVQWSYRYVRDSSVKTSQMIAEFGHATKRENQKAAILRQLQKHTGGLPESTLVRHFMGISRRERIELLDDLIDAKLIIRIPGNGNSCRYQHADWTKGNHAKD